MFLAKACGIASNEQIHLCWELLDDMIWNDELVISAEREHAAFAEHGHGLGISTVILLHCSHMNASAKMTKPYMYIWTYLG
jgi:hypothetical protein